MYNFLPQNSILSAWRMRSNRCLTLLMILIENWFFSVLFDLHWRCWILGIRQRKSIIHQYFRWYCCPWPMLCLSIGTVLYSIRALLCTLSRIYMYWCVYSTVFCWKVFWIKVALMHSLSWHIVHFFNALFAIRRIYN